MIGHLDTDAIEQLLQNTIVGRIGCTDGELTYVVPTSYVYDGEYVYCHTHEGLKVNILRKNPKACFEVENLGDLANWQTVIAQADFEELTDPAQRLAGLQKLNQRRLPQIISQTTRLTEEWPFSSEKLALIPGITFRLRLHHKTGRFEKASQPAENFF